MKNGYNYSALSIDNYVGSPNRIINVNLSTIKLSHDSNESFEKDRFIKSFAFETSIDFTYGKLIKELNVDGWLFFPYKIPAYHRICAENMYLDTHGLVNWQPDINDIPLWCFMDFFCLESIELGSYEPNPEKGAYDSGEPIFIGSFLADLLISILANLIADEISPYIKECIQDYVNHLPFLEKYQDCKASVHKIRLFLQNQKRLDEETIMNKLNINDPDDIEYLMMAFGYEKGKDKIYTKRESNCK